MKALVYEGKNKYSVLERPKPALSEETDAIVKVSKTTICGTDLHILKGDVPSIPHGRVLGHEGLGTIESVGTGVSAFAPGDRVIISCITACGTCPYCRKGMPSHCTTGGWTLGNTIDGTQAEYVRIPHADASLYRIPRGVDEDALVMISDILPTSLECGTLNGQVKPGSTVAVVGAGPVGLSAVMTAQLFSPSTLISIDLDKNRLEVAKKLGATHTVVSGPDAVQEVMEITGGMGVDTAIEAVGMKPTFELCEEIIGVGGHIANIGVHGGVVDLHMEKLWDRNIGITTRLVDAVTSPMLIRLLEGGKLNAGALITHRYKFSEMEQAYDAFAAASQNKALKVIINID
ncbi:alcohol dehydrogenase GroES domain protein [Laetiporus sulphureus 93-53]|uniref:Alcohol dehydrogenase GroES domain protein n=1 Tax=Laetiporus sulphureus 93-53 TaxID=1314785 RepID=A0A165CWU8_9APHY|nr:alcohol dehydrogenase GroES domain protein [Laetiporus sulphureus 93-53]KZT03615.1 alcohol dehydrogenase GroES domain protein [Laetiporus sulphureus 93-53]